MFKSILTAIQYVLLYFFQFLKKLYVMMYFFVVPYLLSCMAVILLRNLLVRFGLSYSVIIVIHRVLLTIVPIIPTAVCATCARDDASESFSMDICFVVWIATILYAWKFL